jgi:hypothetical protein
VTAGLKFALGGGGTAAQRLTFTEGKDIVNGLREFKIENIVLNSCWSACAWHGRLANLCERFLKAGVKSVAGMWGPAHARLIPIFLEEFYESLLIRKNDFETAVYHGRARLREHRFKWPADFVCVQYLRGPPRIPRQQKLPLRRLERAWVWLRGVQKRTLPGLHLRSPNDRMPFLLPTSGQSSARGSHSRIPRSSNSELMPKLIPLHLLFLKLELSLMQHRLVWAYDARYQQQSKIADVEQQMRNLAYVWFKTGFLEKIEVYRAEDFKQRAHPTAHFVYPRKLRAYALSQGSYKVCIFENANEVFAGKNQPAEEMHTAAKNIKAFLADLDWELTYVVILTGMDRNWCKDQKWAESPKGWDYWSFQQDNLQLDPLRRNLPVPSPSGFRTMVR